MLRALERGLALRDFEDLTLGMLMGVIVTYNNDRLDDDKKEGAIIQADQVNFDRF